MTDVKTLLNQRSRRPPVRQALPAGYGVPASQLSDPDQGELAELAAAILADPMALRMFSDQVYDCLCQDLRQQRSRRGVT
jgi:hypothetical protein